jgi:hypothetical protein
MRTLFFIVCFLFVSPVWAQGTSSEPSNREEFLAFWEGFKDAVLNNDMDTVIELTEFPFKTRGVLDDDPEIEYTPDQFKLAWDRLLTIDPKTAELPTSMREIVLSFDQWNDQEILAGSVRIGDFLFHKTGGRWLFYFAYMETLTP